MSKPSKLYKLKIEAVKEAYKKEIKQINSQIDLVKKLDDINSHLQKFNWIFLHPYNQGMDIDILKRLSSETEEPENKILHFFASKFLDLRTTIHFIDGFFNKIPFIKDYIPSIEESVILCLQKDFNGAINVLLPVIEGVLRKYLIDKKGIHIETVVDIDELLKALHHLTNDYVELEKKYLKMRYKYLIDTGQYFDVNQEKQILKKRKEYFELWVKQLNNYLTHNLYLNTKKNKVTDTFNRHLIFHALKDNIDYSFANYLRLFNCINFLSWMIGSTTENCSILSEGNEEEVMNKWVDYMSVLVTSEALTETKNNIYKKEVVSFKRYLDPKYLNVIVRQEQLISQALKMNDFLKTPKRN